VKGWKLGSEEAGMLRRLGRSEVMKWGS